MLAGMIWVKLLILFVYPSLFLEKGFTAVKALKRSFEFFNKDKKYVASVFLIILGISILTSIATGITNGLSGILQNLSAGAVIIVISVFISLVNALIRMILILWSDLFLFLNYKRD